MSDLLLLHPGEMGASLGLALTSAGHSVAWVAEGRSQASQKRAVAANLVATTSLAGGLERAGVVLSVCPPKFAEDIAQGVFDLGYEGLYVDCNAISPAAAKRIAELFQDRTVDGGIVGPPAHSTGDTRLYLSGIAAGLIAELFNGSAVDCRIVSDEPGAASALKMCYAGYTKGSAALVLSLRAAASRFGIDDMLVEEWNHSLPGLAARSVRAALGSSRKAWRFEDEMRQIAETLDEAGLPAGFHLAAADVFSRLAKFRDQERVSFEQVMAELGLSEK